MNILTFAAKDNDTGRKVYSVLKNDMRLSATAIKRLKHSERGILLNGAPVFTDHRLSPGDVITVDLDLSECEPDFIPERDDIEILYESGGLLAVYKPSGMLAHPSRAQYTGTLTNYVSGYLLYEYGSPVCHAVNRLDRETSGVMLFAKSAYMKTLTAKSLESFCLKEYRAVLLGTMPETSGVIDAPIRRLHEREMRRVVAKDGQRAVTHYEVLRVGQCDGMDITEARFRLETGRTHQIRLHCDYIGAPVLGDKIYRTEQSREFSERHGIDGQLLTAERLCFREPLSCEMIDVRSKGDRRFDVFEGCYIQNTQLDSAKAP